MPKMQNAFNLDHEKWRGTIPSRVTEKADATKEILAEADTTDIGGDDSYDPHIYESERCLFCNVNVYDNMLYGPFGCVRQEAISYTTETGDTHDAEPEFIPDEL